MQTTAITCPPLEKILKALGMEAGDMQNDANEAANNTFRIEFENQFAVELEALTQQLFRISARLCRLGKSQVVQNSQIEKALGLFTEIYGLDQHELTLAVSKNDNCLRIICELNELEEAGQTHTSDTLLSAFQEFAYKAFAFKQTFISHQTEANGK